MHALQRYLTDCENKRRRMRDRPSDAVLADLRRLLDEVGDDGEPGGAPSPQRERVADPADAAGEPIN